MDKKINKVEILGVGISTIKMLRILEVVETWLEGKNQHYIVTPNPEFLIAAQKDKEFCEILNRADLAVPDGIGIVWASKFLGRGFLVERIAGVDLMEALCKLAAQKGYAVGFLGAKENVSEKTAKVLKEKYPGLKVVFTYAGNGGPEGDEDVCLKINSSVLRHSIDLLFVAYGQIKQEKWLVRNLHKIPVKVAMGVGGAFDYLSDEVMRAPKIMRNLGLEWFFRLLRQPWRIRRQLVLWKFFLLVLKKKFTL